MRANADPSIMSCPLEEEVSFNCPSPSVLPGRWTHSE